VKVDIFASKPVQTAFLETRDTLFKPIAPVHQTDLEFVIPGDEMYRDLTIYLCVRIKLTKMDRTDFDATDHSSVINNSLQSLFSQCSVTLNGVTISQSKDLYHYRAFLETPLTYGCDAATSH
jgi:hypothetical protein